MINKCSQIFFCSVTKGDQNHIYFYKTSSENLTKLGLVW